MNNPLETVSNVVSFRVTEIDSDSKAYLRMTLTDGTEKSRVMTLTAVDSLRKLTADIPLDESFTVEFLYRTDSEDDVLAYDVVVTYLPKAKSFAESRPFTASAQIDPYTKPYWAK